METLNIPVEVVDSGWKDDVDFEMYDNEKEYISPEKVNKETIERIKQIDLMRGRKIFSIFAK